MSSMRDAMKRLEVIYNACAPEALAENGQNKDVDEFTRLKKKIHNNVKGIRLALKEREELIARVGTTTETAESSYRIRLMIKEVKEDAKRLSDIQQKDSRRKKIPLDEIESRREVVDLCYKHIEEVENLEKKRFNDRTAGDRINLLTKSDGTYANYKSSATSGGKNPFTSSALPDIDVEEDLKNIKSRNQQIDKDLDEIALGVKRLKGLAEDMNTELDRQNDALEEVDRKVDNVVEKLDTVNVNMKKTVEGVMKGDRFLVNCIMACILLSLVGYLASQFT